MLCVDGHLVVTLLVQYTRMTLFAEFVVDKKRGGGNGRVSGSNHFFLVCHEDNLPKKKRPFWYASPNCNITMKTSRPWSLQTSVRLDGKNI
jgi:hypothetical protein